jgi:hypothetical protein
MVYEATGPKLTIAASGGDRLAREPSSSRPRCQSAHEQPPRALTAPARLSGMLCGHTRAVNPVTRPGRTSEDVTSPRRHDGVHRALADPIRARAGRDRDSALSGREWGARGASS